MILEVSRRDQELGTRNLRPPYGEMHEIPQSSGDETPTDTDICSLVSLVNFVQIDMADMAIVRSSISHTLDVFLRVVLSCHFSRFMDHLVRVTASNISNNHTCIPGRCQMLPKGCQFTIP